MVRTTTHAQGRNGCLYHLKCVKPMCIHGLDKLQTYWFNSNSNLSPF